MGCYLGVDTSYYTTSVAVVDGAGRLLFDGRRPVGVPAGARGVAPMAAAEAHRAVLPVLLAQALAAARDAGGLAAVGASARPRPQPGSYLPVFPVGAAAAQQVAADHGVPFYPTTHQEMHIMAGLWSAGASPGQAFLAVHLSGGTTELLRVQRQPGGGFAEERLGGTQDLYAGQFIDRVGVALGLPFPAGPHLERLAREGQPGAVTLPAAVQGLTVSFSGPEAAAARLVGHARPQDLALAVLLCVARTLEKWLRAAMDRTGLREVLLVGGVAANGILRRRLAYRLEHPAVGARLYWADPRYAVDNAVGVALLARAAHGAATAGGLQQSDAWGNEGHARADP